MELIVYLSGEIHTGWRLEIIKKSNDLKLPIKFTEPETNHQLSDNCGNMILGEEENNFWKDNKSAKMNSIKTKQLIEKSDVVVVRFGEKYKQWNAAFDAGYAVAHSKSLIIIHNDEQQHALKEIDANALVVAKNIDEVVKTFRYITQGKI